MVAAESVPRRRGDEPVASLRLESLHVFPADAGMSRLLALPLATWCVFPAGAGMNRQRIVANLHSVPRRRGDEPVPPIVSVADRVPRRRGDEPRYGRRALTVGVFPAGAGMNRLVRHEWHIGRGLPRRRGDEPEADPQLVLDKMCSPQARG